MNAPVAPVPAVNALISIQPITTAIPNAGTNLPPQLIGLPPGTNVQGFVINRDTKSNPILRTSFGDVLVESDVFIRTGSDVVFRIDATQAGRARIISIDGLVPEDYVAQAGQTLVEDTIELPSVSTPQATTQPGQPQPPASATLEALVLKPLLTSANPQPNAQANTLTPTLSLLPQLQALETGQPLKITVLSAALPPPPVSLASLGEPAPNLQNLVANQFTLLNSAPQETIVPVQTAATSTAPQPAGLPASPAASFPSLPNIPSQAAALYEPSPTRPAATASNAPLLAQEVSQPHSAPAPTAPYTSPYTNAAPASVPQPTATLTNAATITVNATVIGHEGDGATVLQTPFATVKLYTPQPLPYGTELKLAVAVEKPLMPVPLPLAPESAAGMTASITQDWQGLGDALAQLQTTQPQAWASLAQAMPTADHRLASALLFFIAGVKGDSKQFLPPRALEALEAITPGIVARMGENMMELRQLITPQPNTNWTSVMLPIYYSGELQPAHLYLRHEEEPEEKSGGKSGGSGQRFLVEVDLSQLGSMQFDGFVRGETRDKQLDLVVRGARALPPEVTQGIRATFDNALNVTGLKGQVVFQTGVQHFVRPLAEKSGPGPATQANTILA